MFAVAKSSQKQLSLQIVSSVSISWKTQCTHKGYWMTCSKWCFESTDNSVLRDFSCTLF